MQISRYLFTYALYLTKYDWLLTEMIDTDLSVID